MRLRNILSFGLAAAFLLGLACRPPAPESTPELRAVAVAQLPQAPDDAAWRQAPRFLAPLVEQDLVEPRQLEVTTPRVAVQALTDGQRIAFKLAWDDATENGLPGASRFSDACAIQLPQELAAEVPAPQMGEAGRGVEITYWRASWQEEVDGREDTIKTLYPGATVDHYPFEAASLEPGSDAQRALADQYAPARRLGNTMEGPRASAVQDLIAEGPGTLTRAPEQRSSGRGVRTPSGWQVVIARDLPDGLDMGARAQIAFAVWDGGRQEVGARKMRSVWLPLLRAKETQ